MNVKCEECGFMDNSEIMSNYQYQNKLYYTCRNSTECKNRQLLEENRRKFGGLEKYGVKFDELEELEHKCRCMQRSYCHKVTRKFYVSRPMLSCNETFWEEVSDPDNYPHFP